MESLGTLEIIAYGLMAWFLAGTALVFALAWLIQRAERAREDVIERMRRWDEEPPRPQFEPPPVTRCEGCEPPAAAAQTAIPDNVYRLHRSLGGPRGGDE